MPGPTDHITLPASGVEAPVDEWLDQLRASRRNGVAVPLCFGWIDGQVARRDEGSLRRRFTPRRSKSVWSRRNVEHVARLTAVGKMTPAGQAAVDVAKADGRWEAAYPGAAAAKVPDDWIDALAANARARAMWEILTSQNQNAITYRIGQVKRAETRAKRLAEFLAMLARGETIHPQNRRLE